MLNYNAVFNLSRYESQFAINFCQAASQIVLKCSKMSWGTRSTLFFVFSEYIFFQKASSSTLVNNIGILLVNVNSTCLY